MGLIVPNSLVLGVDRKVGQSKREVDPEGSTSAENCGNEPQENTYEFAENLQKRGSNNM